MLLTCAASFGGQLVYAANFCCQLGILAFAGFKPGTAALYLGACLYFSSVGNAYFLEINIYFQNELYKSRIEF